MIKSVLIGRNNGFGESVILILPDNRIGIIDCTVDPVTRKPLPLIYLEENVLNPSSVEFIILTHFHQDHYMGLPELLDQCQNARFFVSKALKGKNFDFLINMLIQINGRANPYHEFAKIADVIRATNRKILTIGNTSRSILKYDSIEINVHSPNNTTIDYFNNQYRSQIKDLTSGLAAIPAKKNINLQSVIVELKVNNTCFLYGADMEYTSMTDIGWRPVMEQFNKDDKKFLIFKIPHHGSDTGYMQKDWEKILEKNTHLKLTPYNSSRLPSDEMIKKFKIHSNKIFSTCVIRDQYKKHPKQLRKRIEKLSIDIKRFNSKDHGNIRMVYHNNTLETKVFGSAEQL